MSVQVPPKTSFEKWQDGINAAINNPKWNQWDCETQAIVNEYNRHLVGVAGYRLLDWMLIKAMLWVESGAGSSAWNVKPMQIGIAGDAGLAALISGNEGGSLILPPMWKGRLTSSSVRTNPSHNIRAGVGYLLMKMANYEYRSRLGDDPQIYDTVVKLGDSFEKIAKAQGSTTESLKQHNPTANMLQPGQVLKYQKATIKRVIVGWRQVSTQVIAQRYNGGGDPNYAKKLDYILTLISKGKVAACA